MTFVYPTNLVDQVKERWNHHYGPRQFRLVASWGRKGRRLKRPRKEAITFEPGRAARFPFPSDESLLYMLEVLYHSSFLTEESRRIALRVTYLPPNLSKEEQETVLNHQGTVTRLLEPRPASPAELLRLAPAVNPFQTMILLGDRTEVGLVEEPPLAAWGLLHLGSEWWEYVSGRSTGAECPPHSLTVTTFAPGELVVSSGGSVLLRLREGSVIDSSTIETSEGAIGDFLKPAADALYTETCARLKRSRFHPDDSPNEHPRNLYYATLSNILLRTRERQHGGSFVIVPDELNISDPRLADRIAIKYSVDAPLVWEDLLGESVSTSEFYDLLFPEDVPTTRRRLVTKRRADPEALYRAGQRLKNLQGKIHDFERFSASLSGVDGAVVMTKRLKILGFGGEITATSPTLSYARLAADAGGTKGRSIPITSFGTRHRSVCRFCSSFENAVCFVVSQDAQVKGVKRVGPHLVMWNDLTAKEQVL